MRLTAIHTYPIKGCYRVDHDQAEVEPWGLAGDRRWLIVDPETGRAITQREEPALTRVRPVPLADGAGLLLRTPGMTAITIAAPVDGEPTEMTLFRFTGRAVLAGAAADEWLSTALQRKVRLVWQDDPTGRPVNPSYSRPGDTVSFADNFPVLLANMASLNALNDLIGAAYPEAASYPPPYPEAAGIDCGPLAMTRFRPNMVLSGPDAWAEDGWIGGRLRVGQVTFRVAKPCDRCVVTTTDQETGQRGREPLRTLGRYRNVDQKLMFATHLIPDSCGTVAIGEDVVFNAP